MTPSDTAESWHDLICAFADLEGLGGEIRTKFLSELEACEPGHAELEERQRALRIGAIGSLFSFPVVFIVWRVVGLELPIWFVVLGIASGPCSYFWIRHLARTVQPRGYTLGALKQEWLFYCSDLRPHLVGRYPISPRPPAFE